VGEGTSVKAASYIELVAPSADPMDKNPFSGYWGVGIDSDITSSGLKAVLSAINGAIGDRALPAFSLTVGLSDKSSVSDIATAVQNELGLQLPRKMQASFLELLQAQVLDQRVGREISLENLIALFKSTYNFNDENHLALRTFNVDQPDSESGRRIFKGVVSFSGKEQQITGEGNGPLSALLAALKSLVPDSWSTLAISEFVEHSIGHGSDVKAASYVELVLDTVDGKATRSAWGVGLHEDITTSGLRAVLGAAAGLGLDSNLRNGVEA